jgi:hypothetical protein
LGEGEGEPLSLAGKWLARLKLGLGPRPPAQGVSRLVAEVLAELSVAEEPEPPENATS